MFRTIYDNLQYRSKFSPHRRAVIGEVDIGYGELWDRIRSRAAYLTSLGLKKGQRIGLLDFNHGSVIELILGAGLMGIVPVLLNWRLAPTECRYILEDSDCSVLFAGNDFATLVNQLEMDALQKIWIGPEWSDLIPGQNRPMQASAHFYSSQVSYDRPGILPEPDEIFLQLYTSGTTSNPKGVPLTHFNVVALIEQLRLEIPGFGTDSRNLVCAPFFHIAGVGCLFLGLFGGAANFVLPRFDPLAVIQAIGRHKLSHGLMVPAMQQAVISHPEAKKADFSSLKHLIYGASPISRSLLIASHSVLKCDYTQAYGLTETTGVATILSMDDHRAILSGDADHLAASAGKPAAGIEMEIRKEDGICEPGESGEVFLRGSTVMPGYWSGEKNNAVLDDGWFATGDIGYVDSEGYLFLMDRKNDLIISKGEKIFPIEVERFLAEHPEIEDVSVVGIPDAEYGEVVCAFLVAKREFSVEELREWNPTNLAQYKRPRKVVPLESLPRNPSGKVLRRELRKPYWEGQSRQIH